MDFEDDIEDPSAHLLEKDLPPKRRQRPRWMLAIVFLFSSLIVAYVSFLFISSLATISRHGYQEEVCTASNVRLRREWRHLSRHDQITYLRAVQCLQRTPGEVSEEQSRFADFAYHHSRIGNTSHNSAQFLSWHRLILDAFEKELSSYCNYTGTIPYWDWSLDHKNLSSSPVWDHTYGFGGNGSSDMLDSGLGPVGNGSCVIDGPFANLTVFYYSRRKKSHCLSRGFMISPTSTADEAAAWGRAMSPTALEKILSQDTYDKFWKELEHGPHDAAPHFIRGDFGFVTSPNDPLFFSHHAQLDRLWYLWQMRDVPGRLTEYNGRATNVSPAPASLYDLIEMGGLGDDMAVEKVMDTTGGFLCYKYV